MQIPLIRIGYLLQPPPNRLPRPLHGAAVPCRGPAVLESPEKPLHRHLLFSGFESTLDVPCKIFLLANVAERQLNRDNGTR